MRCGLVTTEALSLQMRTGLWCVVQVLAGADTKFARFDIEGRRMAEPSNPKKPSDSDKKPTDKSADTASDKTAGKKPEASTTSAATPTTASSKPADVKAADKATDKKATDKTDAPSSIEKTSSVPGAGASKPGTSSAAKSASSGGRSLVTIIVVIALVGAGAYATRDVWLPSVEPYLAKIPGYKSASSVSAAAEATAPQSPVAELSARLGALESKVATGESSSVDAIAVQAELNAALARIDDLERRLAEVREMATAVMSSSGASVDLSPMMKRIDALEATDRAAQEDLSNLSGKIDSVAKASSGGAKASGLVLAIAQLRDTALSGRPFASQLDAIGALAAEQPEVRATTIGLGDRAESGLPMMDSLKSRFSDIAGDIVTLARSGDGDWVEQAAGRLSQLVALRRTDGQSGDPVEDAVAGIESSMAVGDIAVAVTTASALSDNLDGEAQKILENWLIDAKARASAVRALDALNATALAGLGG